MALVLDELRVGIAAAERHDRADGAGCQDGADRYEGGCRGSGGHGPFGMFSVAPLGPCSSRVQLTASPLGSAFSSAVRSGTFVCGLSACAFAISGRAWKPAAPSRRPRS